MKRLDYRTGGHTMLKIRTLVLALGLLMSPLASADTQVSIGINLPLYPGTRRRCRATRSTTRRA